MSLRIIVLGYLVRGPLGGIAWHHLQYVLGLARLGHDVVFFEDSDDYPSCYDPVRDVMDTDPTYGLAFTASAFERLGLGGRWTYYDAHRHRWLGPAADKALSVCRGADVLLNVSCVNPLRAWMERVPVRILVDTDPVFTQVRHLTRERARATAAGHTAFFSYGENIGQSGCTIPSDGFPWQPTRQPVVMDAWPCTPGSPHRPLSTVMLWGSYRPVEYQGIRYGMKAESFPPFVDLPARGADDFEIALGSPAGPREHLARHGWTILDPREPTRDPWAYQDYIRRSKAEFSVAKQGYVISHSGWFSERTAAYLASGRPAVIQETGFSRWLRPRGGVLAFSTPAEAASQLEALNSSYEWHCRQARLLCEEYFESAGVLNSLLDRALSVDSCRGHRGAAALNEVS